MMFTSIISSVAARQTWLITSVWKTGTLSARPDTVVSCSWNRTTLAKRYLNLSLWGRSRDRHRRNAIRRANRYGKRETRISTGDSKTPNICDHDAERFCLKRFLNPWDDLSQIVSSEDVLYDKVESTTRTFGIVAAMMGSLAAALLTINPYDGYDSNREPIVQRRRTREDETEQPFAPLPLTRRNTLNFIEHVTFTHHVSGTSLLVSWGIKKDKLDDFYTACCAGSFYSGVLTTVISSVLNAWMAATPTGGVRNFVRAHSWFIVAMPALLGISTSLAGAALFIGIDREHGTPVSYVGLAGSLLGGGVLALVTGSGWMCTYRALTKAVLSKNGKI